MANKSKGELITSRIENESLFTRKFLDIENQTIHEEKFEEKFSLVYLNFA